MTDMDRCPLCGAPVDLPVTEPTEISDGLAFALVITDPGTAWQHLRDVHPDDFAIAVQRREKLNRYPERYGSPRRVDGVLLRPGESVANIAVRSP